VFVLDWPRTPRGKGSPKGSLFSDGGPLWSDPGSVHMGVAADLNATIERS